MFTETLPRNAEKNLALLGESGILKNSYLSGGTAAALQLGHRISFDLDFFTPDEFMPKAFVKKLTKIGKFTKEQASKGTVLGTFMGIKFSLFLYKYPVVYPFKNMSGIKIADLRDIAAMKIDAISTRGLKRDFIDLYFLCKEGLMLDDMLGFYDKKFGKLASNLFHIKKSLVYFVDAEPDEMPRMLKPCNWNDVKSFFKREVVKLVNI